MNHKKLKQIIQDRHLFGDIDPVEAVLFLTSRYSLLPDIFDIFGRDEALEFIERFGGKTIKIPSQKNVEEALQQLVIWKAIESSDGTPESSKRIAVKFGLKESELKSAHQRVRGMLDEQRKRFGRPEQTARQRSDVGAESTTPDSAANGQPATDSLFGVEHTTKHGHNKYVTIPYEFLAGEGEESSNAVVESDSALDR